MVDAFDPTRPATLSQSVLEGVLRAQLGFAGVVFSDDLEMKAIADHYGVGEAACEAIAAGCDALLICSKPELCFTAHAALVQRAEHDPEFAGRLRVASIEPLGIDMTDMVALQALQRAGIHVTDGSRVMLEARKIKTAEEIALLDHACGIVDAVYDEIYRLLRPGAYEHKIVARAQELLFEMGSDHVEAINAVSGDRCNPHPHVFSDRLLRPGDQAFFDVIHSFMGYRTCYYRTFNVGGISTSQLDAYKQCREWLDAAIDLVRPGTTTDEIASVWPTAATTPEETAAPISSRAPGSSGATVIMRT